MSIERARAGSWVVETDLNTVSVTDTSAPERTFTFDVVTTPEKRAGVPQYRAHEADACVELPMYVRKEIRAVLRRAAIHKHNDAFREATGGR